MFQGAHCLAQGVALQVEEHQLGAGSNRLKCCMLVQTLGRSQGKAGRFPQILSAPGYPSYFPSRTGTAAWQPGWWASGRAPRGSRALGRDCKHLSTGAKQEVQGAGWGQKEWWRPQPRGRPALARGIHVSAVTRFRENIGQRLL